MPAQKEEAKRVLEWAQNLLEKGTFPRCDYKEFLELVVVSLGGKVEGFTLKLPGPDHHARWMSKCIYYLKIQLLSKVFWLTEDERMQTDKLVRFILLIYSKYWFTTSLSSSSAWNDLDSMSAVLECTLVDNKLA